MIYPFRCRKCGKEYEFNLSVKEYDEKKDKLVCNECQTKLVRTYSLGIKTNDGFKK